MTIVSADEYFASGKQLVSITKTASATSVAGNPSTVIDIAGQPGVGSMAIGNTTTGIVPTDLTAGFPLLNNFGGLIGYLGTFEGGCSVAGRITLYDRIWHAGSVSMLALATTNFASQPAITQRLPGGNDWSNLEILLEFNQAVSATATTITVTYTNEAGVTGRSTGATATLSGFATRRLLKMPLQAGDKGVQKIESIIVGGTVATTGTVNVILARRLGTIQGRVANWFDTKSWDAGGGIQMFEDMALWPVCQPDGSSTGVFDLSALVLTG